MFVTITVWCGLRHALSKTFLWLLVWSGLGHILSKTFLWLLIWFGLGHILSKTFLWLLIWSGLGHIRSKTFLWLLQFGLDWDMYLVKPDGTYKHVNLRNLLPMAFTPESLEEEREAHWSHSLILDNHCRNMDSCLFSHLKADWSIRFMWSWNKIYITQLQCNIHFEQMNIGAF